jgi:hypothetical protein
MQVEVNPSPAFRSPTASDVKRSKTWMTVCSWWMTMGMRCMAIGL